MGIVLETDICAQFLQRLSSPQEREVTEKKQNYSFPLWAQTKEELYHIFQRLNISKMSVLPRIICRFNAVSMKIPTG